MMSPQRAIEIARAYKGKPCAEFGVFANQSVYVLDEKHTEAYDPFNNLPTVVSKETGEVDSLGASEYVQLMPTLQPVDP